MIFEQYPILSEELQSLLNAFDGLSDIGIEIHDNFHPIFISDSMDHLKSFKRNEYYEKNSLLDIIPPDSRQLAIERYKSLIETGKTAPVELQGVDKIGKPYWVRIRDKRIKINGKYVALTILNDITEQKNREIDLHDKANHDELTGLANRRGFQQFFKNIQSIYTENNALFIIDLDNFKAINDNYGHDVGDMILCSFARHCQKVIRQTDLIARYGGDEFALFSPVIGEEQAYKLAEKIRKKIESQELIIGENTIKQTVSIGFSIVAANTSASFDELFKEADKALYQSKELGRNRVTMYKLSESG